MVYWNLIDLSENNPEHNLFESTVEEFTRIAGFPIYYYIFLEPDSPDPIYGEDPNAQYTSAYETKLVYEPTEEQNILDSFGITSDETVQYMQIPKKVFYDDVAEQYQFDNDTTTEIIPKVGDCIRTLWNNKIYEIIEVGSEQKIFQAKKLVWEVITRPYRHSQESDSAETMLFQTPDEVDFPDSNVTTTTKQLSAYGDNENIEDKSDTKSDTDTAIYGF